MIGALVYAMCAAASVTAAPPDKSTKPVEFYLAETVPAKGLVEITVVSTDRKIYLPKQAVVTNKDIATARLKRDANGEIAIAIEFTRSGAKKIAKATEKHKGKPLAILLDGKVIVAPIIRSRISAHAVAVIVGITKKVVATRFVAAINGK